MQKTIQKAQIINTVNTGFLAQCLGTDVSLNGMHEHNDDEIIITESPRVLDIKGPGCLIRKPDLSCIRYMAHQLEIRDVVLGTLNWIPEWILEVYLENCRIMETTSPTNLPQSVIQLTCLNCIIDNPKIVYPQLIHHRIIRLELIGQYLQELPECIAENAHNLLFLNLTNNELTNHSKWPKKVRGLKLSGNKLLDLVQLGQLPPYLEDLDLSNNLFSEIPTSYLPGHLRKLNMSRNNLQWLPENPDEYPPNLRELIIAGNCGLNDLTDAAFPDMLTTLNAAACEIEKLPHDWEYSCLINMDLSDNNISNLDEIPIGNVLNINYVGNPCWVESGSGSRAFSPSELNGFIDDNLVLTNDTIPDTRHLDYLDTKNNIVDDVVDDIIDSCPNSVFTSGVGSPSSVCCDNSGPSLAVDEAPGGPQIEAESPACFKSLYSSSSEEEYMQKYREAISRSSSAESLQNMMNSKKTNNQENMSTDSAIYPTNDPLVKAIDYVVASGLRKVESFIFAMSDILAPAEYENNPEPASVKPSITPKGYVFDDMDNYGILGSFD